MKVRPDWSSIWQGLLVPEFFEAAEDNVLLRREVGEEAGA
jgi:hypothetical protein